MKKEFAVAGVGGVVILIILAVFAVIGAVLWPYTINSWLAFIGKPEVVMWYHGAVLGFVPLIGQATIPAAVITWVLMLVLV